jgi:hypothetical protein
MKQMQRGAAGNSTPERKIGKTKHLSFAHQTAPVKFSIRYVATNNDAAGPWPPSPGYWGHVCHLPDRQSLWRKVELHADSARGLTGWPAELVAEIAVARNRCVAEHLIEASASAIDTLSDERRELLLSRLQHTIAELPER